MHARKQEAAQPRDDLPSPRGGERKIAGAGPLAHVPQPRMRVVSKGWNYREELQTVEQVRARLGDAGR